MIVTLIPADGPERRYPRVSLDFGVKRLVGNPGAAQTSPPCWDWCVPSNYHPRPPARPPRHRIELGAAGRHCTAIRELDRAAKGVDDGDQGALRVQVAFDEQVDLAHGRTDARGAREIKTIGSAQRPDTLRNRIN